MTYEEVQVAVLKPLRGHDDGRELRVDLAAQLSVDSKDLVMVR